MSRKVWCLGCGPRMGGLARRGHIKGWSRFGLGWNGGKPGCRGWRVTLEEVREVLELKMGPVEASYGQVLGRPRLVNR